MLLSKAAEKCCIFGVNEATLCLIYMIQKVHALLVDHEAGTIHSVQVHN